MKINARLLSIIFFVVVLMSVSSGIIYYSFTIEILKSQQVTNLQNSKKDFVFSFHSRLFENDYEIDKVLFTNTLHSLSEINSIPPDFIFIVEKTKIIKVVKEPADLQQNVNPIDKTIKSFIDKNPSYLIQYKILSDNQSVYYGSVINEEYLNRISEKINAEVIVLRNNDVIAQSHNNANAIHLGKLQSVHARLNQNFKGAIESIALQNEDLMASLIPTSSLSIIRDDIQFVVFNKSATLKDFSNRMFGFVITFTFAGISLSLILVLLFTSKLREQIRVLIEGVEETSKGDLKHRVPIVSTTELGKLGAIYNDMLDELEKREIREHEYSSFISLINQNPGLKKVSETSLEKIINSTNSSFGVLYLVEDTRLKTLATFGIESETHAGNHSKEILNQLIVKKKLFEKQFTDNFPVMKMGLLNISIKSVLLVPIIYNKKTVAIIELLSEKNIPAETKEYLLSIREQLAIGLTNASAFGQLENLVHELQELNDNYQNQNEKLKTLSNELTIKADELDKEKNKAVDLTKAKSQFLANMSHELKTPLNSILGLTELSLKETDIKENVKEKLAIVLRNGKRLLSLINNILEFSKLESEKSVLNIQKFNLAALIVDVENVIKPLADQKKLSFEISGFENYEFIVESDQEKLEQIAINLLSNAIKFTSEGFVKLNVDSVKNDLIIKVEDSGIGVPEEFNENIFEEFEQADAGNAKKYGGAGLGLAICRKYCDLLNGSISFESNKQGTTFYCTFTNAIIEKKKSTMHGLKRSYKSNLILVYNNTELGSMIQEYLPKYEINNMSSGNVSGVSYNLDEYSVVIIDLAEDFVSSMKFGLNLRNDKKYNNSVIIYTYLGTRASYALDIFDYSKNLFAKEEFLFNKNKAERFLGKKITSVLLFSRYTKEIQTLREDILLHDNSITLNVYDEVDLDLVKSIKPDLILSDLVLGEKEAVAGLHNIKNIAETKNIPIIVNTNIESDDQIKNIEAAISSIVAGSNWVSHDILRVIKNRLKLDYNQEIKANLFNEEPIVEQSVSVKSKKDYKIMIVDDDEDTLFTVGEIIKGEGYTTKFANNGLECLNQLTHYTPDLILLDIMMPVMDGFETIKRIRLLPKFKELSVIALTAHAMLENKEIINKNGFNGIVTKPLNSGILINTVSETLDKL
ncbi:MAG: response regulator [Melioribacteraceae bacterium]|nr:response regulator [Melioribacteraceae bacterium]